MVIDFMDWRRMSVGNDSVSKILMILGFGAAVGGYVMVMIYGLTGWVGIAIDILKTLGIGVGSVGLGIKLSELKNKR